jgi:hypothetical protein
MEATWASETIESQLTARRYVPEEELFSRQTHFDSAAK